MADWSPPVGAALIEPGVWEAPSGLYVEPNVWAKWERDRDNGNVAYAAREREAKDRRDRRLLSEVLAENEDLRMVLYLRDVVLAAVLAER